MTHSNSSPASGCHSPQITALLACVLFPSAALAAQPPAQNGDVGPSDAPAVVSPSAEGVASAAPEGTQAPFDERAPNQPRGNSSPALVASPASEAPAGPVAVPADQGGETGSSAAPRHGLVPLLRVGYAVGGSGELTEELAGDTTKSEYEDISGLMLEFDLLGHVSPGFRLGGGLIAVPTSEVDRKSGSDFELGSEGALVFIGEGLFDLSSKLALTVRGFIGFDVLNVGGDYKDVRESVCEGRSCSWDDQFTGATAGLGVGLLIPLEGVSLRADLMTQGYAVSGRYISSGETGWNATLSGSRTLLMAGVEL